MSLLESKTKSKNVYKNRDELKREKDKDKMLRKSNRDSNNQRMQNVDHFFLTLRQNFKAKQLDNFLRYITSRNYEDSMELAKKEFFITLFSLYYQIMYKYLNKDFLANEAEEKNKKVFMYGDAQKTKFRSLAFEFERKIKAETDKAKKKALIKEYEQKISTLKEQFRDNEIYLNIKSATDQESKERIES